MKIVFIMTPIEMTNLVVVVSVGVILNWDMMWHKDKGGLESECFSRLRGKSKGVYSL